MASLDDFIKVSRSSPSHDPYQDFNFTVAAPESRPASPSYVTDAPIAPPSFDEFTVPPHEAETWAAAEPEESRTSLSDIVVPAFMSSDWPPTIDDYEGCIYAYEDAYDGFSPSVPAFDMPPIVSDNYGTNTHYYYYVDPLTQDVLAVYDPKLALYSAQQNESAFIAPDPPVPILEQELELSLLAKIDAKLEEHSADAHDEPAPKTTKPSTSPKLAATETCDSPSLVLRSSVPNEPSCASFPAPDEKADSPASCELSATDSPLPGKTKFQPDIPTDTKLIVSIDLGFSGASVQHHWDGETAQDNSNPTETSSS